MQKIFGFIAWKWRQYDIWQKLWWFACFWLGGWISADKGSAYEQVAQSLFFTSMAIVFFKWFVWDMIKHSWNEYNKEQEEIVRIMKEGVK